MIKVFSASETVFDNNGEKIINPIKAVITKEDNADYSLALETSINDKDYVIHDNIIVADTPWGAQAFNPAAQTFFRQFDDAAPLSDAMGKKAGASRPPSEPESPRRIVTPSSSKRGSRRYSSIWEAVSARLSSSSSAERG